MFNNAKIVARVPARWKFNPAYMHTFGITDNYFVIVEQPLAVSLVSMFGAQINNQPLATCLKWHNDENVCIYIFFYFLRQQKSQTFKMHLIIFNYCKLFVRLFGY